ncbi:sugar-binding domain-containing protein [Catalinimonas niigatensis]|uniref:sugar-binding domain-containing protein n=1 Tax=Catalinimonas niigatensis TaxID=1397264 RepID=UPI0026663BCF|nr:sugar-binding domain-containing protein [Catalinimonas niigatensis]WPP49216.1 glycoside hydrolase family 2 TIM barrel-domain containing protein [Catalinimonas niigatensis]
MKIRFLIFCLLAFCWSCNSSKPQDSIDLKGSWAFKIDASDRGEAESWFTQSLEETVELPGSMATNDKGDEVNLQTEWVGGILNPDWYNDPNYAPYMDSSNFRFPFWLQPVKKYTGAAWYQKEVDIPDDWQDKAIILHLERCHWESSVWVDDQKVGSQNSLSTAHRYPLTSYLSPGKHTISIRIDNRIKIDLGENSHSISDHTQSNWNGIVGEIYLESRPKTYFSEVQLFPDASAQSVTVRGKVSAVDAQSTPLNITAQVSGKNFEANLDEQSFEVNSEGAETDFEFTYDLGEEAKLWDEFDPNVYQMKLSIENGDEHAEDFGFRDIAFEERQFVINDRPTYLRGTLECAIFPETGYPSMDVDAWKKIYSTIQAHGLNHVRFHSWCPPKAAFIAADEMGVYLQVEAASWANQSTTLGDGKPVDQFVQEESERIVQAYGNHPSFLMMAYGNEPGGNQYKEFLAEYVNTWKAKDDRRIYTSAAGWPDIAENEFHVLPAPRIQAWGQELKSIINGRPPSTNFDFTDTIPDDGIAVVSHEIGQWCVYPDFKEIERYTGVLKAKNFELFRESLEAHQMGDLAEDFLMASGKLQALCYKADIEAALRTTNQAGFQLLDLHDFPGQGTALVGVLNPFWEEKGYITAEEYSRFSNSTVPLARLDKRIFVEGESMEAKIEIAHFGKEALQNVTPNWTLKDTEGNTIVEGQLDQQNIALGNGIALGNIAHTFEQNNQPRKVVLEVSVDDFSNHWDLWVYPQSSPTIAGEGIRHVAKLDASILNELQSGGKVLLSLGKGKVAADKGGEVGVGFSSIFWNTAWTGNQKPHTLGILCDPEHPALQQFPTEFHSNWQWWDAMSHSDVVNLNELSDDIQPIVRVIDDWVTNRSLGLIFEVKVGEGKLLISGVDLRNQLRQRPEARQMLSSLMAYMESDAFAPTVTLSTAQLLSIQQ